MSDEVVISQQGGFDARRVPVAGAQASWEISGLGSFSAFVSVDALAAAGLAGPLDDYWLTWDSPAGPWGGVITGQPEADGVMELTADGWAALFRDNAIEHWRYMAPGPAAGMIRAAINAASGPAGRIPITIGTLDESSPPIETAIGAEDLLDDAIPRLAEDGGIHWVVTADRVLNAGSVVGIDRSARVRVFEGRHILDHRLTSNTWASVPSEPLVVERDESMVLRRNRRIASAAPKRSTFQDSVRTTQAVRRRGGSQQMAGKFRPRVTITNAADSRPDPLPTTPIELTLAPRDGCWRWFDAGDTIRVEIGSARFTGTVLVMSKALDAVDGALTIAGEATPDGGA